MAAAKNQKPNTFYVEVSGAGLPEVDGLYVPSEAPPQTSESGTQSSPGYWNGKMAWDRADGKSERSPALSYSNSYKSWRICRLDGHLAYDNTCDDDLPPTDTEWHVYKKGVAPAPSLTIYDKDPREAPAAANVVFVLGGPGSGKGTMCELAELQLGWAHLSAGELIRAEQDAGGPLAQQIEDILTAGQLVPNEISVRLLRNAMAEVTRTTGRHNFLIDGFPRSLHNLEGWLETSEPDAELPTMLYFECPYPVLEKRILGRARYSGRSDDNIESVKLRFDTFKEQTLPTVEYFRARGKVVEIDAGQDRQDVFDVVKESLAAYTDKQYEDRPLSEKAEMLLGLRPWPKEKI